MDPEPTEILHEPAMDLDFRRDPRILSTIVDAMADGVFTVDASGTIIAWSQGAERITGYASEEVVGRSCRLFEGPNCKGFAALTELLRGTCDSTSGTCHQECKVLAKDGREVMIHGSVRLVSEPDGRVAGAVGNFADVTPFLLANERIALLEEQVKNRDAFGPLVGASVPMQEAFRRIRLAAHSDVTVFICGESGTGKELAAAAIHSISGRCDRPFIAVNCSAIPESLLESELFGHVKGAFTGADRDKLGLFQAAEGGTLFLDEIGDVSPLLQLKLLRVLQEREVRRVGDANPTRVNVRLITATNRDLKELVASGSFREDFYYRIHVFEIRLPPLRERREDIPLLARHFIDQLSREYERSVRDIARDALQCLMEHDWPGNVRELRNALEHAFVTVSGQTISLLDLPAELRERRAPRVVRPGLDADHTPLGPEDRAERLRILDALSRTGGNRTEAARLLGTSRVTLWKKIRKLAIDDAELRGLAR
jgi:PAS domain S-box-containing protein